MRRFIGELYMLTMLTGNIMASCLLQLFTRGTDEESLECVCKLLTTVGKKLEMETTVRVRCFCSRFAPERACV